MAEKQFYLPATLHHVGEVPADYEVIRIGIPSIGELFLSTGNIPTQATPDMVEWIQENYPVAIVAKRACWLYIYDASKFKFPHKPARFRNIYLEPWTYGEIIGKARTTTAFKWQAADGLRWKKCQVYSPDGTILPGCQMAEPK